MEKKSNIEHIIINPIEILELIEDKYPIKFSRSILDFQYDTITHVFGLRFFRSKGVISDSLDEDGLIILNKDKKSDKIASIEITDLNIFLTTFQRESSISV